MLVKKYDQYTCKHFNLKRFTFIQKRLSVLFKGVCYVGHCFNITNSYSCLIVKCFTLMCLQVYWLHFCIAKAKNFFRALEWSG